jgi:ParB-like chromosome segregation protein Spo0J
MQLINIELIKPNPKNPRTIKDDKFKKLVKSLIDFPQMLEKRPLVCFTDKDGKYVVLGGNMRLKAAKDIGIKALPILLADDWTEEQKAEFLIKDNVGFGDWDWEELNADWDVEQLEEWGLDLPKWAEGVDENNMDESELDLDEQFDPIGESKGFQRIVFIFNSSEDAENWINKQPEKKKLVKRNMAWQVDLTSPSI